jgi:hypothetical protein
MRCKCKAGWVGGVWLKEFWICVEDWKKRQKVPEPGPKNISLAAVVDSFVYDASGLSVVASMSHYRDEAGWLTKAIPSHKDK